MLLFAFYLSPVGGSDPAGAARARSSAMPALRLGEPIPVLSYVPANLPEFSIARIDKCCKNPTDATFDGNGLFEKKV